MKQLKKIREMIKGLVKISAMVNRMKKIWIALFCSICLVGSLGSPSQAWEMEGILNMDTGLYTHDFIAEQSIQILLNDWYGTTDDIRAEGGLLGDVSISLLAPYLDSIIEYQGQLNQGALDPDKNLKEMNNDEFMYSSHFYDPGTKQSWILGDELKNNTAKEQAKRFTKMAVAKFMDAEESTKQAENLIKNVKMNLRLDEKTQKVLDEYERLVFKSDLKNSKEGILSIRNLLEKYKNGYDTMNSSGLMQYQEGIKEFTDGMESIKMVEKKAYLIRIRDNLQNDILLSEKQLVKDTKKAADLKIEYEKILPGNSKTAKENELLKAEELKKLSEKRLENFKLRKAQNDEELKALPSEETMKNHENKAKRLKELLRYEKLIAQYEKAVKWYEVLKAKNGYQIDAVQYADIPQVKKELDVKITSFKALSGSKEFIDLSKEEKEIRYGAIKKVISHYKRLDAMLSIKESWEMVKDLSREDIDLNNYQITNSPQAVLNYGDTLIDYRDAARRYENELLGFDAASIQGYVEKLKLMKENLKEDDQKLFTACEKGFEAYTQAKKKYGDAIYFLGYASHFFVDMCNPHHAANNIVPVFPRNHSPFEIFTQVYEEKFKIDSSKQLMNNEYPSPSEFIHQSTLRELASYQDVSESMTLDDFIEKETDPMSRLGKDYYYIKEFEKDALYWPSLFGYATTGIERFSGPEKLFSNRIKKLEPLQVERWMDTAEKTLGLSQAVSAKFYLSFLKELKNAEKFTLVLKTPDTSTAGTTDDLYMEIKSGQHENSIFLDTKNDTIDHLKSEGREDPLHQGGTKTFDVYISRNKLKFGNDELPQLDACKITSLQNGSFKDEWSLKEALLVYDDRVLMAQSQALSTGSEFNLKVMDKPKEVEKVTLRIKNSANYSPENENKVKLFFGIASDQRFEKFKLNDSYLKKLNPGDIDAYDFYIIKPGTLDNCWMVQEINHYRKDRYEVWPEVDFKIDSCELFINNAPVKTLYYDKAYTFDEKKLYILNQDSLKVRIKTCDELFGGTNNTIVFKAQKKAEPLENAVEIPLDSAYENDFERGKEAIYSIPLEKLGIKNPEDIESFSIRKKDGLVSDDWKCELIEVFLNDSPVSYEYLNKTFDKEEPYIWKPSAKLYVSVENENGEKVYDEKLALLVKMADGSIKKFENPVLDETTGRKIHCLNMAIGLSPIDLSSVTEVWLENMVHQNPIYQNVSIYADAGLTRKVANVILGETHTHVNGLKPEAIPMSIGVTINEEYNVTENSTTGMQAATYIVFKTEKGQEIRKRLSLDFDLRFPHTTDHNTKSYEKNYSLHFEMNHPEFLLSEVREIQIVKENTNAALMPEVLECKKMELYVKGRKVLDASSIPPTQLQNGFSYHVQGLLYLQQE